MQNAIDNHIAAFSAPASIALLQGVPYWMAAAIFIAISIYLKNKKPWKS